MTDGQITQLFIYPVKSLAGIAVDRIQVTGKGLAGDREWMIVNEDNRFVTQRQLPQMARIQVSLTAGGLRLESPHAGTIQIDTPAMDVPEITVTLWSHNCQAQAASPEVNAWLAEALRYSQPLRLVKFAPSFTRAKVPERFGDATTLFADAAPFLVANQSSLEVLNARLQQQGLGPVGMRHFRPNVVADGLPAFAEHTVNRLGLSNGSLFWELCDHCQRCSIITVDPDTGERHPYTAPFRELTEINPMPNNCKAPAFGVNARLLDGEGMSVTTGTAITWSNAPS